jgi:hypothetical protein
MPAAPAEKAAAPEIEASRASVATGATAAPAPGSACRSASVLIEARGGTLEITSKAPR